MLRLASTAIITAEPDVADDGALDLKSAGVAGVVFGDPEDRAAVALARRNELHHLAFSTCTGPNFSSGFSIFDASPTTTIVALSGARYFCAAA